VAAGVAELELTGIVIDGKGEARAFTQLEWVGEAVERLFGFRPFPGTLNLRLTEPEEAGRWRDFLRIPGAALEPPPGFCRSHCYAARVERVPAAIVVPQVDGYPAEVVELMAPVSLRDRLSLSAGDRVALAVRYPAAADAGREAPRGR
jgi:riboflavin kinase